MGPITITISTIQSTTTTSTSTYFSFSSSSIFWLPKPLHILPSALFLQPFWFFSCSFMMEQTLGLLGGGGGGGSGGGPGGSSGGCSGGGLSNESASSALSKVEKDYMGFSSEGSSYENEAEIELGLGLSLSSGIAGGVAKNKGSLWGEYGRILTAKDLPNGFSGRAGGAISGTKRAADCVSPAENGPTSTGVSQVVGWPPIRAYRMNSLVNQSKTPNAEEDHKGVGGNEKKENLKKKINYGNHKTDDTPKEKGHLGYIKVNMDGLPIGRKVDLNAHNCYESLAQALEDMFFNSIPISGEKEQSRQPPKLLDESSEFVLTYEDKEGDWMLVGDVPWGMFLCTVKRLRIMRNSEANGIAPTFQERHERQKGKPI